MTTNGTRICQDLLVARLSRKEAKARTRERLIAEAERLFVEQGYAATSLEQIAQAADVTKGAIYGHFDSKEGLLLSAIEMAPSPSYPLLTDQTLPLRERLERFGQEMASGEQLGDGRGFSAWLEFLAAVLRNDAARVRYAADVLRRLSEYAAEDPDEPLQGTTRLEVWVVGTALATGLRLYGLLMPDVVDADLFAKSMALLGGLYPDETEE
jgi:AcrR family transcriptional regulator